jgi:hypothetical protein
MATTTPPTDQRAGVRPIAFALDNMGAVGQPVTLTIRPQDLTRNEPSRVSVHQTLGREVSGWVDNFGEGLGSVTISGHTGWGGGGRPDGVKAFEALNKLVQHDYHAAKQAAIDSGADPGGVKLLFVDMLDDFAWPVTPLNFVLRRSKSQPLLLQYNISLQALSTSIDNPLVLLPQNGGITAGVRSLTGAIATLNGYVGRIQHLVSDAVSYATGITAPIAATVKKFVTLSTQVFGQVKEAVTSIQSGASAVVNNLVGIASDMSKVGVNVFRTISAIAGLPASLKAELSRVASAYNEVFCIFKNSLRPAKVYENYDGLYGASNCSSTTGGHPASIYADRNAFDLMRSDQSAVGATSSALTSAASLGRSDPVLAPMPLPEMNRHLNNVVGGVLVTA